MAKRKGNKAAQAPFVNVKGSGDAQFTIPKSVDELQKRGWYASDDDYRTEDHDGTYHGHVRFEFDAGDVVFEAAVPVAVTMKFGQPKLRSIRLLRIRDGGPGLASPFAAIVRFNEDGEIRAGLDWYSIQLVSKLKLRKNLDADLQIETLEDLLSLASGEHHVSANSEQRQLKDGQAK